MDGKDQAFIAISSEDQKNYLTDNHFALYEFLFNLAVEFFSFIH